MVEKLDPGRPLDVSMARLISAREGIKVIVGGTLNGLPLAFRWSGTGTTALTASNKTIDRWAVDFPLATSTLVADPVMIRGRVFEVAGLRQVRVALEDVVRL